MSCPFLHTNAHTKSKNNRNSWNEIKHFNVMLVNTHAQKEKHSLCVNPEPPYKAKRHASSGHWSQIKLHSIDGDCAIWSYVSLTHSLLQQIHEVIFWLNSYLIPTWSPGWGLMRDTWSYLRRNRAHRASSFPWAERTWKQKVREITISTTCHFNSSVTSRIK